jgi:hypothetical protein
MLRREFLQTSAASIAPVVGGRPPGSMAGSKNGRLVITYDDAPIEDYTKAFPVHKEVGVPGCASAVSTWVGNKDGFCTVEQLQEMKNDAGFEILSQTREHSSLTETLLERDVKPDDKRIYPKFNSHAFHSGYPIEITDGDKSVIRQSDGNGEDEHGVYIKLTEPVGKAFSTDDNTVERYPEKTMEYILSNSQAQLRHMGFAANNLIVPYDRFTQYAKKHVKKYYDAVGNAVAGTDGLNDPANLDPYGLKRWYFIENGRRRDRFHRLDTIARKNQLAIFGAHTYKENITSQKIREVLEGAKERGIEVVTLQEALEAYGVTESTSAPSGNDTDNATTTVDNTTTTVDNATESPDGADGGDGTDLPDNPTGISTKGLGAVALLGGAGASLGAWRIFNRD